MQAEVREAVKTVIVLDRLRGVWSPTEIGTIMATGATIERQTSRQGRIVVTDKPPRVIFANVLGHGNFIAREIPYPDRWKENPPK